MLKGFKKDTSTDSITFPPSFGGYYTYKDEDGKYVAYRLLDFNIDVLHRRLLDGYFNHKPSFEEVKALQPSMHVPQAATVLLSQTDLTLLGSEPLTQEDLSGYKLYCKEVFDTSDDATEKFLERVIGFSHESMGMVRLRRDSENPGSFARE